MRTLHEVKQEIEDLQKRHEHLGVLGQTKQSKKDGKRITFLSKVAMALEKNCTEEFLKEQKKLLDKKIAVINRDYQHWMKYDLEYSTQVNLGKNPRTKYNSLMGMKELKDQLSFVTFILD